MSRWWLAGAFVAVLCLAWLGRAQQLTFEVHQVRFDESRVKQKPTPTIPKSWVFVMAEHYGENETHLWFQDGLGGLIMMKGFTPVGADRFVLDEYVNHIEAEK